jgi:flagellar biosynthesis protein
MSKEFDLSPSQRMMLRTLKKPQVNSVLGIKSNSVTLDPEIELTHQQAVALSYLKNSGNPKVVAKGKGLIAESIINKARENGIFVHESRELLSLLMGLEMDQDIPPALYEVIASLLATVYHLEAKASSTPIELFLAQKLETAPKVE